MVGATVRVLACVASAACGRMGFEAAGNRDSNPLDGSGALEVVASECVTWSPVFKANNVELRTFDFDASSSGTGIAVASRGLSSMTGQRAYFEIVILSSDNNAEVGVKDDNFSNLGNYHSDLAGVAPTTTTSATRSRPTVPAGRSRSTPANRT